MCRQEPTIDCASEDGIKPADLVGNISLHNVKFKYPARSEVQVMSCV